MSKVDYQLDVKWKVKTYHGNMLKRYLDRCEPAVLCVMSRNIDEDDVEACRVEEF